MSSTQNMPMGPDFSDLPTMPIALVGMACRLSGGSDTPSKFWDMLMNKRSGFSTDAGNRFNHKAHWHPQNDMNGTGLPSDHDDRHLPQSRHT
jgi:acyl transferase domain-containing protein